MIKINFVGDIMLGELLENYKKGVKTLIEKHKISPFEFCSKILKNANINIGNLECILSKKSHYNKPFSDILRSNPEYIKILKSNNINVLNTANNHALDHGRIAFYDNLHNLNKKNIKYFGYTKQSLFQTKPLIISYDNIKLGFLGYNIANFTNLNIHKHITRIKNVIKVNKENCDILILSMHWGYEYTNIPSPKIVKLGKQLLSHGVDILYGHHSHRIQGILKIGNKIFAPSLGNFIFDDNRAPQRITGILQIKIDNKSKINYKLIPCYINNKFQPIPNHSMESYYDRINKKLELLYFLDNEKKLNNLENHIYLQSRKYHKINSLRVRKRFIKYFYNYFPYISRIFWNKIIRKRNYFSLVGDDINHPKV